MDKKRIRVGIDVGGTFTDVVAIDAEDFSVIAHFKIPTTHNSKKGVAQGVVDAIEMIIEKGDIDPDAIVFIAHGTTQATNALLEGDVTPVGIIGMGKGIDCYKAKLDTNIEDVQLTATKALHTVGVFIDTVKELKEDMVTAKLKELKEEGAEVVVASEAFSVDQPQNEQKVMEICNKNGIYATGSHEISKLYGLKARTRTAAINASILPKMMETANMTQNAVSEAKIKAPLMIMRCDGGVMRVEEIQKRPILTILSGPAAGVAGALMYEKVSDGIFLEVGGTSTDITAIKNGQVIVKYAEIGGHKTYINSLDVRTVGVAGGSMVRYKDKKVLDVGPRSAHIGGFGYCTFADPKVLNGGGVIFVRPLKEDPQDYLAIKGSDEKIYAVTLTCAVNYLGDINHGDYAHGNTESSNLCFSILSQDLGVSGRELAQSIIDKAVTKVEPVVKTLIKEYDLNEEIISLTGGGGAGSVILNPLSKKMRISGKLAKNAPIISTIGAALAMVRDVVERTIINPSREDIIKIRREAEQAAILSGASPESIEVNMEVDSVKNTVRAIAMGTTELKRKNLNANVLMEDDLMTEASKAIKVDKNNIHQVAATKIYRVYKGIKRKNGIMKFFSSAKSPVVIIDVQGIVKLQLEEGEVVEENIKILKKNTLNIIKQFAVYDESGERPPNIFMIIGDKILNLKGLPNCEQIASIINIELEGMEESQKVVIIAQKK